MRINSTVYYVLKDRLGSAYATTDASGNTVGETRYYATGETRLSTGTMFTDKLFTGQREMAGLGIYQFGARFYSPKLGRFISADTIVPNVANPQLLNRYSYVNNNPLRYTDPTGHMMTVDDGGGCTTCVYTPTTGTTGGGGGSTTTSGGGDDWWDDDGGSDGGGGTSTPTPTPTYTPAPTPIYTPTLTSTQCPMLMIECIPTATSTLVPTPTLYGTPTPFMYGPVNTAAAYCFGEPDLIGAPGCGDILDIGIQGVGVYAGYPQGSIPPVGEMADQVITGIYFLGDLTPEQITYLVLAILIAIPVIPPF